MATNTISRRRGRDSLWGDAVLDSAVRRRQRPIRLSGGAGDDDSAGRAMAMDTIYGGDDKPTSCGGEKRQRDLADRRRGPRFTVTGAMAATAWPAGDGDEYLKGGWDNDRHVRAGRGRRIVPTAMPGATYAVNGGAGDDTAYGGDETT